MFATLLALIVQHWILLTSCWATPDRSLVKAAQTVRAHARHLLCVLPDADLLCRTIALLHRCLGAGCRLNPRRRHPTTAQLLLDPSCFDFDLDYLEPCAPTLLTCPDARSPHLPATADGSDAPAPLRLALA